MVQWTLWSTSHSCCICKHSQSKAMNHNSCTQVEKCRQSSWDCLVNVFFKQKKFVLFLLSFFPFVLFTINLFLAFYLFCENIFFHFFVYSHWSTIYVVWLFDSINFYLFVLFWNCFMTLKVRIQIKNANWCLSTMGSMS